MPVGGGSSIVYRMQPAVSVQDAVRTHAHFWEKHPSNMRRAYVAAILSLTLLENWDLY
jgi:hypothetical protein